jgi:hypothetical protein
LHDTTAETDDKGLQAKTRSRASLSGVRSSSRRRRLASNVSAAVVFSLYFWPFFARSSCRIVFGET